MIKNLYLLALIIFGIGCASSEIKQPNVIVVLVDDLGWKDVGFAGSTFYETPNIDKISKKGMIFSNSYSASAVCSPTRAALLTGRYPARIGINDWIRGSFSGVTAENALRNNSSGYDTLLNAKLLTPKNPHWMENSEVTLAELLKENGYTTCHIGKWHLGFDDWYPEQQGFDENYGGSDFGEPPNYFDPYESGRYVIESLPSRKHGEYLTDREGNEAVNFIKRNLHNPFYLNLNHYAVHTPLQSKQTLTDKYIEKAANDSKIKDWNSDEDGFRQKVKTQIPLDGQRNPVYAGMIESVDDAIGKIIEVLEENDLMENTIIVFTSDNGGHIVSTDNSPLKLGKGHSSEGGIRVPLSISFGNKIKAGINNTPICSIDILPTITNLLSVKIPENITLDGMSFKDVLYGEKDSIDDRNLYWHFPHYWWGQKVKPYSIIRSGNWKLIKNWENSDFELYNLEADISEKKNLAELNRAKVEELNFALDNWLNEVGAKKPILK